MEQIGLKEILLGGIGIIQVVVLTIVFRTADAVVDIRNHLGKLNGSVGKCDALRQAHEQDDDRKHERCEDRVEKIEAKLMGRRHGES